jgi:hypothetical protein
MIDTTKLPVSPNQSEAFPIERKELRIMLDTVLLSDDDFMAFVSDNFNEVFKKYGSGMSRVSKSTLLLEGVDDISHIYVKLRQQYPDRVQLIEMGRAKEHAAFSRSNISYGITNQGNMYSLEFKAQFGSLSWDQLSKLLQALTRAIGRRLFLASAQEGSIRLLLASDGPIDVAVVSSLIEKIPLEAKFVSIDLTTDPEYQVVQADGTLNRRVFDRLLEGNAYYLSKWSTAAHLKYIYKVEMNEIEGGISEIDLKMKNLRSWLETSQVNIWAYIDALRREKPPKLERMDDINEMYHTQNILLERIRDELDSIHAMLAMIAGK